MLYFKVYKAGEMIGAETAADPAFVRWQEKNNMLVRCQQEEAEGIVSEKDNDTIYLLNGKQIPGVETDLSAVFVSQAEYEEAISGLPDPEDDTPEIPDDEPDAEVLSRAELTALVRMQAEEIQELRDTNSVLTECILEMSEVVYGE